MGMLSNGYSLVYHILASNIVYTLLPLFSYYLLPIYSPQNTLILDEWNPLSYSISFDAAQFLTNQYKYENNYAFLPGFVLIAKYISSILPTSAAIAVILLINKVCTALSSIVLMNIINLLSDNQKLGRLAGILFLFNPVGIFFHVVYSQAIYSFLTFAGIYLFLESYLTLKHWESTISNPLLFIRNHFKSLLLLGISCSFRTTGVFISTMYGFPILSALYKSLKSKQLLKPLLITITGAFTLSFFLVCLVVYLHHGYNQFCLQYPNPPYFCNDTFPNIYSYIQEQFWNCGFLRYYSFSRALFVIIGLPSLIVSLVTLSPSKMQGLNYSYYILLFITITYSNIQSSARFFSTHPLYFYGLAKSLSSPTSLTTLQKALLGYIISYNTLGILMFPHRFIWT